MLTDMVLSFRNNCIPKCFHICTAEELHEIQILYYVQAQHFTTW